MSFSVRNHTLELNGDAVEFVPTTNQGGAFRPQYLVLHYTAGMTGAGAVAWLAQPASQASAHLVIDRNGNVTQMVRFNRIAWHAGRSEWAGLEGMNRHSIGIELVNAGRLIKVGDTWQNWAGNVIPADQVVEAPHKHGNVVAGWHAYPAAQIKVALEVALALHSAYGFYDVVGHEDVSRGRRVDPGPAFPMLSFAAKVLGRGD